MHIPTYQIPRTKNTENVSPWGNTPKFHVNWLQDFPSVKYLYNSIIKGDIQALNKYSSLLVSIGYTKVRILNISDFIEHLDNLILGNNYSNFARKLEDFLEEEAYYKGTGKKWFVSFVFKNGLFNRDIEIYLNQIKNGNIQNTGELISIIKSLTHAVLSGLPR